MRTQRQRWRIASLATLALAALALTSFAALGPRYGGRLVIGVLDLDSDTSPRFTRNRGARLLMGLRHETLVVRDASGVLLPSLAQHWSSAANGREWAFELVGGARFHDDRPVTAEDVVRSVLRFLRSDSPAAALLAARLDGGESYRRGKSDTLPGVSAPTPQRVLLRFVAEQIGPPVELTSPAAAITGAEGVACGPFLVAHVVRGERAALLPFDQHVRGRPFVDNLDLTRSADRPALRLALEQGAVHAALGEPGATSRIARLLLLLDQTRKPFDTLSERRRVARAFDRDLLVRRFMPEAQPLWRLLPSSPAPSDTSARPEAPSHPDVQLALNVDASLSPLASQRVVAHLVALGYRVTVAVLAPDDVVATAADARLLLWCPEVDDPLLALHELALLAGTLKPQHQAALATESARGPLHPALEEQERALLETHTVVPLALAPLAAIGPAASGINVTPTGTLLLEDAWLPF